MPRPALLALAALACNEYGLDPKLSGTHPGFEPSDDADPIPTTGEVPGSPGAPGSPGDSGGADACYEPEFGFETTPSVRLFSTDPGAAVVVTMVLSDTAYSDSFTLDAPSALALGDAWVTPPGAVYDLGSFAVDAELTFGLQVQDTGDHWQSGPATRNGDGVTHVAVTYEGDCSWLIGFEDLYGGGDQDYNDVVLRVEGMLRQEF